MEAHDIPWDMVINWDQTGLKLVPVNSWTRGEHCIGECIPTRDRGQSEVKRSRRNFEAGQVVKLGIGGSLSGTVKVSPGDRWAWLMLDSQGSRPDFRCGQGVKHENLLGQDLDRSRGWKYRRSCSVPPPPPLVGLWLKKALSRFQSWERRIKGR